MRKPAVCVIVPVWGAERTLARCVDSILTQQVEGGLSCVLVDDGSPDNCGVLCDNYARNDPRVTVLHKEDGGVSTARNAGLDVAFADYIVFLDSDDALRPGALQAALDAQRADPDAFVLWQYTTDPIDKTPVTNACTPHTQQQLARLYLDCLIAMPWNKLYRADLAQSLKFNASYTLGEDLQFGLDYIALLGRKQPHFHYTVLDSALTYYNCGHSDTTLSTRYHPEYCTIWPEHYTRLNEACAGANCPPEDLLPLHRAELRVYAEGVADILRRDPAPEAERRAKARSALDHPWLAGLLRTMRDERCYSPYYLPCRWHSVRLIWALAESARQKTPLFGKLDWGGYYLLLGRYRR